MSASNSYHPMHAAVRRAVQSGALTRRPCEKCGDFPTQAHHDDYDKPLDVRWLCPSCHSREHRPTDTPRIPDPYASKRHKFYAEPWIASGLDELARINKAERRKGQTRSQIIEIAAMKLLRANAARLRKAGVKLPDELFSK